MLKTLIMPKIDIVYIIRVKRAALLDQVARKFSDSEADAVAHKHSSRLSSLVCTILDSLFFHSREKHVEDAEQIDG